ncbi:MAG: LPD23 domain-containing protein [Anaerovoracaceae bacterium]
MASGFDDIEKRIQKGIDEENRKLEAARKETAQKRTAKAETEKPQPIPYAKKATGGKNRTGGSSLRYGETMAEKKGIQKPQLPIPYAQSDAKSIAQFAGQAAYTGLTGFNKTLAQTADFLLPDFLTPDFVQKGIDYYKNVGDEQEKKLQDMQTTKGKEIAGQLIQGTVQALPNAALAMMSGGTSLGAQGASIGAQTGAKALQASAQQAAKNPAFWTSFLQTAGPTYEKEKEQGASEARATASAMANALIGSAIEIGGGIEKFNPNQGVLKSLIKTAGEEGLEEMKQYSAENLVNKALGSNTAKWFSADQNEDAVINPTAQAIQGAYGAGIGAIMGGGQRAAFAGLKKATEIPYAKTEGEPQAEVKMPEDTVQNAASGKELKGMRLSTQAQEKVIAAVEKRSGAKVMYADLPEGIDGMYENGVIRISNTAKNPAYTVLKHELTHHIESSGNYQELSNFIQLSMRSAGYDVQAAMQEIMDDYAAIGKELSYDEASREFTAKFAEEYLFNSEKSIERLARENPNIFRQIYDWIVDTIRKIGASDETKFLIDAQRKYEKALRTVGNTQNGKTQYLFAGVNALNANEASRQTAETMLKSGKTPQEVWEKTGWRFGLDGKWRFEIDDSKMEVFPNGDAAFSANHPEYVRLQNLYEKFWDGSISESEVKELGELEKVWGNEYGRLNRNLENDMAFLEDVIQHDELFDNYPQLRRMPYRLRDLEPNELGRYKPSTGTLEIRKGLQNNEYLKDKRNKTIVHEIQHAIQQMEDFEEGGNLDTGIKALRRKAVEQLDKYHDGEYKKEYMEYLDACKRDFFNGTNEATEYIDNFLMKEYNVDNIEELKYKAYESLLGEREAENAAERLSRDALGRRNTYPDFEKGAITHKDYSNSVQSRETMGAGVFETASRRRSLEDIRSRAKSNAENSSQSRRNIASMGGAQRNIRADNVAGDESAFSIGREVPLEERVSGDQLLDAQDTIDMVKSVGGEVDTNGYVTIYHRTSAENAKKIRESGKMSGKEDGIFFSTQKSGYNDGYGDTVVELKVPAEILQLDDIFDNEAHFRIPLKNRNAVLDVSEYLTNQSYSAGNKLVGTGYTERLRRASNRLYGEEGNKYLDTRIGRKTPISPLDEGFAEVAAEKPIVKGQKRAESYQKRANRDFVETVKESLGVNKFSDSKRIQSMTEDTVKKLEEGTLTTADRDRLFDEMFAEGVLVDEQFYRQYANLKQTIRNTKLHVTEDIRRNVTDFNAFRTHNLNTVRLSNDSGAEIDVFYDELRTEYPELFPELNTPAEMLERISEVGKSIKKTETKLSDLSGAAWEETYDSARKSFDTALNELEKQVNIVKKYLQNKEEISVEDAKQRIGDIKMMRREVEKIKGKVLLAESDKEWIEKLHQGRATEKMVRALEPNAEAILTVYEAEKPLRAAEKALKSIGQEQRKSDMDTAEAILEGSENWKDKRGIAYGRETAERNMVDVAGKEKGKELNETYFRPVHDHEALATKMKKELRNTVKKNGISTKDEFDITDFTIRAPGLTEQIREARSKGKRVKVSESTLLQLYGEKRIDDWMLEKLGADVEKISSTATVMRNIYNQLIDAANTELVRFGYEPIEYRKDYFPHFTEDKPDSVLAKAASALGFNIQRDELPADISGLTHTFRPGKKWFRNALSRTSEVTEYDAIKGFDIYLEGISDVIFHTEDIQKLRALENAIRYKHGSEGMKKQIEEVRNAPDLSEMDKEARLETIYRNGDSQLGSLATWIRNYTDTLAGKKAQIDRVFEHNLGRGLYNTSKAIENRVAANMVAINPGSWLTNFIPLVQGSEVKNSNIIRGMAQTVQNMFRNDGFTDMSTFITNRKGSDVLWKSTREVWQDIATKPMQWIDEFVSESLVRARYIEEIENGKSINEAMNLADDFAASVIADRSKGALPTVFNAKNPVSKILTMYQVEVNNQWSHLFKDIPRTEENVMKIAMSFAKFAIGAYLFDDIFEWLVGRRPALDPISWVNDYVGDTTGKKLPNFIDALVDVAKGEGFSLEEVDRKKGGAALAGLGKNVAENIPFVGGVLGGGRVPIQSALPDVTTVGTAFGNIINGDGTKKDYYNLIKEAEKPVTYILPPFGGGQLKKIGETARNAVQGGSFGMDSDGNQTLRFAVDNDPLSIGLSALFGQYSVGNSGDYVESGFKSLSAKPTNAYKALTASGLKPTEAEKLIRTILKSKKKTQQVNELLASSLTPEQKNAVGKALWPDDARDYGNQLKYNYSKMSDSQKETINALTGTGMSQEKAMSAYEAQKDYSRGIEKAVALMEESYTKDVLAALGISDETAEKASALHDAGFGVQEYRMAWDMANTNGNSGVSMEEAKAYLDSRTAMSRQEKYAMFKALTGCKDKNNPYR